MSIFSDYACGALSDEEFAYECAKMNAEERYYEKHMYDEYDDSEEEKEDEDE